MKTNEDLLVSKGNMDSLSKGSIWFNRVVLLFVSFLFTMIGVKNIFHPIENAALAGITLSSAHALSVARVSMGAFPLGFAIVLFTSLFPTKQIYRGILSAFILICTVTAVRILGFAIDGAAPFIAPEITVTILSGVGLYLEMRRQRLMKTL